MLLYVGGTEPNTSQDCFCLTILHELLEYFILVKNFS